MKPKLQMTGRRWMKLHLWVAAILLVMLPPTLLWWQSSVTYLVWLSWAALFYAAISSYQATRLEVIEDEKLPPGVTAMDQVRNCDNG